MEYKNIGTYKNQVQNKLYNEEHKALLENFKKYKNQTVFDKYFSNKDNFDVSLIKELFQYGYKINDDNYKLFNSNVELLILDFKYNKNSKYINLFKESIYNENGRKVLTDSSIFSEKYIRELFSLGYVLTSDSPKQLLDSFIAIVLDYKNTKNEYFLKEYLSNNPHISRNDLNMLFESGFRLRIGGLLINNLDAIIKNYEMYHDNYFVNDYLKYIRVNSNKDEEKLKNLLFKLIDVGYLITEETPDVVFVSKQVSLELYRRTKNDIVIDKYRYHLSDMEIEEVMNLGYIITKKSNPYILSSKKVFKKMINKDPNIINLYIGENLDRDILELAFINGYNISSSSVDFICNNSNIIKLAIKYNQIDEVSELLENNFTEKLIIILSDYCDELKISNIKKQVLINYNKIENDSVKKIFLNKVFEIGIDNLSEIKIVNLYKIIERVENTNSSDLLRIKDEVINNLLNHDKPIEYLDHLEKIFLKNNLPYFEKVYLIFQTLYPNVSIRNNSSVLKNINNPYIKNMIIEIDLLKCFIGSNNRNLKEYIKMIEKGSYIFKNLFEKLSKFNNEYIYEYLYGLQNSGDYIVFVNFINALKTITDEVKGNFDSSNNLVNNIIYLMEEYKNKDLSKYILEKIFSRALNTDITSFHEILDIMNNIRNDVDEKNRKKNNFVLKKGDLIKGLDYGGINYLENILNNGSLCKEMLGCDSQSDITPLDTDVCFIKKDYSSIRDAINYSFSRNYGPIWFVMKNDDRFMITKMPSFMPWRKIDEEELRKNKFSKYELFSNGNENGGIRTGFPSSLIDYIITENYDDKIGLIIAMNGFYIPVVDMDGNLLFSPKDYDNLRGKMSGLSYFEEYDYKFSDNLSIPFERDNDYELTTKKEIEIRKIIKDSVKNMDLTLKDKIDGDITFGSVELINIGSTGRGTNCSSNDDFDFVMRVDKSIINDEEKLETLRDLIIKSLGGSGFVMNGNIRKYRTNILINNISYPVNIDISFTVKTDKLDYSTDASLNDRLSTIKRIDKNKYEQVLDNIVFAKEFMKSINAYKPSRVSDLEGGMGGVGIENWILQNGGSFIDAATSFLNVANNVESFEEFKSVYHVYDFGYNFLSEYKNSFPHDDFIENMSEFGFKKIKEELNKYLNYEFNRVK